MKPSSSLIAQIILVTACWLALLGDVHAQVETILHNFADGSVPNDGTFPNGGLVQGSNGNFYGTTPQGGFDGFGCVFVITPAGSASILHNFKDGSVPNDGGNPNSGLIQATDGNFYGTTVNGGAGNGTIFRITPQGTETILHSFGDGSVANDGKNPQASLCRGSDGNFYGTTAIGGTVATAGMVFKITPGGVMTILHSFGDGSVPNDGSQPTAALIQGTDGNFYGTTKAGGSTGTGTLFEITPLGVVTIIFSFIGTPDAVNPEAPLVQGADGNFYGTTIGGGSADQGTVFKVTPQGTETILHNFGDGTVPLDGSGPTSGLLQGTDGNFYGMTSQGTTFGLGVIYEITPQGTVTTLHVFGDGSVIPDGGNPQSALIQASDGNFYGTAQHGGTATDGTVFKLTPGFSVLTSAQGVSGNVGLPFTYQVTGTYTPTSFAAANLPAGLSINPVTGLITGTPTTVQGSTVALTLTNAAGSSNINLSINILALPVPSITSILTAYASVGTPFTYQTVATNLANGYNVSDLTGTGLSFDTSTGILSGSPTSVGTTKVTLVATNTSGASTPVILAIQVFAAPPTPGQEYNIMHYFDDGTVPNDGDEPESIIQGFDGNFYGVTFLGGAFGNGAVFEMTVQGTVSIIYSFSFASGIYGPTGLIQGSDGNFYGTTTSGSQFAHVFQLTPSGQLTILHAFFLNGASVQLNRLIQGFDGNIYGTFYYGGTASEGIIYKVTTAGVFTVLHNFGDGSVPNDGSSPEDGLIQATDGNFYGTTYAGGSAGFGTVFQMTPAGTVTIIHNFGDGSVPDDGNWPDAGVIQASDGFLYGTTSRGGGCAFKMTLTGTETILHYFGSVPNEGTYPAAALVQGNDGNFYGTTEAGGTGNSGNAGTVFQMTPSGTVTVIHNFADGSVPNDGLMPMTPLIQSSSGNYYGVTRQGGVLDSEPADAGTIYSFIPTQAPVHAPVFTGSAFATSGLYTPFSFTPTALFGVSGSGAETGSFVKPAATGFQAALVSLLPQWIRKSFSSTNWTLTQGNTPSTMLPNDLSFDSTSGTISGTPEVSGTYTVTMTPNNAIGSGTPVTVTLYINVPPGINSGVSAAGSIGTPFTYQIEATPPATSFGATYLPGWLTADPATGMISGTPPASGAYVFNAVAANASGQTVQPVTLTVAGGSASAPTITSSTTAGGTVGTPFTYQITTAHPATSYTALPQPLPTGLLFNAPTGAITGTPSSVGTFTIPITATNASGTYASVLTLTVGPASAPGIAGTLSATVVENTDFLYQIPATGVVSSYTLTGSLPAGLSYNTLSGVISGIPTASGAFPVTVTVGNGAGTSDSTLTLNVSASANFNQWETSNNFTSGSTGLTDTPYNDGVPNLLKYLYNIDPAAPISATDRSALPAVGSTTTGGMEYLTLTYRQYALQTGITVNVETSPDLINWTIVSPPDLSQQVGTDPNTGDPIMQVGVHTTGSPQQYIRLDVTSP